jgi:hypothetical protein
MNAQTTAAFAQDKNVGGIAPAVLTDAQLRANAAECQVIATYWPDLLKDWRASGWCLLSKPKGTELLITTFMDDNSPHRHGRPRLDPGIVPAIHVFDVTRELKRGCPRQEHA